MMATRVICEEGRDRAYGHKHDCFGSRCGICNDIEAGKEAIQLNAMKAILPGERAVRILL